MTEVSPIANRFAGASASCSNLKDGGWKMTIGKELLDILACPKCKGDILLNESEDGLICDRCKLLYEIRDGIPIMLIDEAKSMQ